MDIGELELVQIPTGEGGTQVVLCVGGKAIIGVDSLSMGGDERGSFMDVRFRSFRFRGDSEKHPDEGDSGSEEIPE